MNEQTELTVTQIKKELSGDEGVSGSFLDGSFG